MGGIAVRSFHIRDSLHEQMLAAASASSLKDGSGMSGLEGVHRRLVFWPRVYLDRRSVSTRSEAIPCLLWSHLDPVCCKFRDAFSRFNVISCGLQLGIALDLSTIQAPPGEHFKPGARKSGSLSMGVSESGISCLRQDRR